MKFLKVKICFSLKKLIEIKINHKKTKDCLKLIRKKKYKKAIIKL